MLALVIGMVAAAVVGYLVGLIALRRTGIYFAMITVAIAEVFYFVEFNPLSDWTGGENGLPGVPTPSFDLGFTTLHFTTGWSLYQFLAFCYFVGIVIALRIVRSPVGAIFSAIRDNPLRAAAVGHNIHGYKLTAFVIAAAYAGFAGGLLGVLQAFMPPDAFTFDTSGQLVMQTAIGGARHAVRPAGRRRGLAVPAGLPAGRARARRGLEAGAGRRLRAAGLLPAPRHHRRHRRPLSACCAGKRRSRAPQDSVAGRRRLRTAACAPRSAPASPRCRRATATRDDHSGPILQATGLTKRYGGLVANSDIDFTVNHGELRGIIGPNGAGKIDLLQDADLRSAADLGHDRVRGPRHHRHERHRRLPARPDQELPGQPAVHRPDGAREPHHRRARRAARQVPARSVPQPRRHSRA